MSAPEKVDYAPFCEQVALRLWGDPNPRLSNANELRWGARGSRSLDRRKGIWFDHESGAGGSTIELIRKETGQGYPGAVEWLTREGITDRPRANGHATNGHDRAEARKLVEIYPYNNEHEELLFEVCRYEPKDFRQRRPDGDGGWIWNLDGVERVLYRLPKVMEEVSLGRPIFICEGEKDCDNLANIGIVATTNPGGANKWLPTYNEFLRGADVILLPDNDDKPGREHMDAVATSLTGVAKRIRYLDLVKHWPQLPYKKDVSYWLEQGGGTAEKLWALAEVTPDWKPVAKPNSEDRLSALPALPAPRGAKGNTGTWDDPDESILDDRRGVLPEFPIQVLPVSMHDWLLRAARGAGVTPAHVAVPLLGIASSLIGTARRVKASSSWSEPLALWTAIVGFSGTGKTPGLDVTRRVLSRIERDRKGEIAQLQLAHETRAQNAKAAKKKWERDVEAAVEAGQPGPQKPAEAQDPGPFVAPRLCVSDSTIERIAVLLEARQRGIAFVADELARLFLNMKRYSAGQDNEFWLEAWNGQHFIVERQGRPPVNLDYLLVGLTGGFQPDKLARSFEGDDDGMYARFCFAWPEEPSHAALINDVAEIEPEIQNALNRIIGLPSEADGVFAPRHINLSDDAVAEFEAFRIFLYQTKKELDGREREWIAKGATHVLRLAGTLAYLDWAMGDRSVPRPEPQSIEDQYVRSAVTLWRNYFWPHSRAALRQIGLSERHSNARRVLRWLQANQHKTISREDIRRDALGQRLDAEQTQNLIDGLVRAGWVREVTDRSVAHRPARRWEVNPILFGQGAAGSAETAEKGEGRWMRWYFPHFPHFPHP